MVNLVNTSLYSFNKTYDYQSVCDPEKDSKAAAGPRSVYVVRRRARLSRSLVHNQSRSTDGLVFSCVFFPFPRIPHFGIFLQPTVADLLSVGWWASSAAW